MLFCSVSLRRSSAIVPPGCWRKTRLRRKGYCT